MPMGLISALPHGSGRVFFAEVLAPSPRLHASAAQLGCIQANMETTRL